MAQHAAFKMPPEAVTTVVAKPQEWPAMQSAIGSVEAVHGVVVSADLPGVVEKISFESGKTVRAGDLLVQLDTRQEQAQLAAAEAQAKLTKVNLDRLTGLRQKGIAAQADWDSADAAQAVGAGADRRDPGDDRAQDHPRPLHGRARHPRR